MKGLRSSNRSGEVSDYLARLSLDKRSVQMIGDDDFADTATGKSVRGALGKGMRGAEKAAKGVGKTVGATGEVGAKAGVKAGVNVGFEAGNNDDAAEIVDRRGKQVTQRGATKVGKTTAKGGAKIVKSSGRLAGKAVKGSIVAAQKRAAAAKAAKSAASTGASVTRLAAAQARVAAAAANTVRAVVATVTTITTSIPLIAIISVVLATVMFIISIFSFFAPASAPASDPACDIIMSDSIDPSKVPATSIAGYNHEQLVNAAHIIQAGQERGLSVRDQTIAVMTAMGESSLKVIENGDAKGPDSRGLFQQRDNWGTAADRLDPYISAGKFFDAMTKKVPKAERKNLAPTLVAHRTQVNADPYHYEKYWVPATAVVRSLSGLDSSLMNSDGSCGVIPENPDNPGIPGEIGRDGWAKPGNGPINSRFGPRPVINTPAGPTVPFHYGLDFEAGGCGGPVWAARDGEVNRVFDGGGGGMIIEIDHGEGLVTRYTHSYSNEIMVSAGQKVKAGDQIALTGSSGYSTGCHLHFEVHQNGTAVDPLPILTDAGVTF